MGALDTLLIHARTQVGNLLADRMISNISWYGIAELVTRASRLITTVIIARALTPIDLGVAALAITSFELVRVLASSGLSELVTRASTSNLAQTTRTAYWLGWIVCAIMAAIQIIVGLGLGVGAGNYQAQWLAMSLAGVFLIMPLGLVNAYLLKRENGVKALAAISTAQVVADNVLTAVLAAAGAGAWAVVLPKLVTAPIWLIGVRRAKTASISIYGPMLPLRDVAAFCAPILGSEMLSATRVNLDKVLVGSIAGIEALGIYYFIFNAGIGLSLSLTTALSHSLFPEFARFASRPKALVRKFDRALIRAALPISGLIVLQAIAALFYVPIVFGTRWISATELVAALCLSAATKPLFDAAMLLVRASGAPMFEFFASTLLTLISLGALAAGLTLSLDHGIAALALMTLVTQAGLALWVRQSLSKRWRMASSRAALPIAVHPASVTPIASSAA